MCIGFIPVHITMQEILKQKSKNKKPKTFGAVNNAYEIYHLVLERGEVLVSDITLWYKSWKCAILKCGYCRKSVFTIDKYFHAFYDNVIQINNKCFNLR